MKRSDVKPNRPPMPEHGKIGMCCFCGGTFHPSKTVMFRGGVELCKKCAETEDDEPDHDEGGSGAWGDPFNQR